MEHLDDVLFGVILALYARDERIPDAETLAELAAPGASPLPFIKCDTQVIPSAWAACDFCYAWGRKGPQTTYCCFDLSRKRVNYEIKMRPGVYCYIGVRCAPGFFSHYQGRLHSVLRDEYASLYAELQIGTSMPRELAMLVIRLCLRLHYRRLLSSNITIW
jgi:hypothetical protein